MFFFLLFPLFALSAEWKPLWELSLQGSPEAAVYSVGEDKLFVSVQSAEGAKVVEVSVKGELQEEFMEAEGKAGPLKFHGDRLYWLAGETLYSKSESSWWKRKEMVREGVRDFTFDNKGNLYLATKTGVVGPKGKVSKEAANSLFMLVSDLFALVDGASVLNLQDSKAQVICPKGDCVGLDRAPDGSWITVDGESVIRAGQKREILVKGSSKPGRLAYVYRRDSKEDFIAIPFPEEKKLKAYSRP